MSSYANSYGICDQVAVVGMGCTRFDEHWDRSLDDLIVEAAGAACRSAEMTLDDIDAFWFGTSQSAASGLAMARPLKIHGKPVTRVENYCATGSDALRQACYAVASGAYDTAMALGAEKVKDSGYQGLNAFPIPTDGTQRTVSAAAMFSLMLPAYADRYGVDPDELRYAAARIASKNHHNGARNPLAQFRREVSAESICEMPAVAGMLSVFDCAGVADGAAAAIVCRAVDCGRWSYKPLYVKGLSLVAGTGAGSIDPDYDYTTMPECAQAAADAYAQAGVTSPRSQLALAEVHDCFTPTELVLMEDLGFSERGQAWQDVLDGVFDLDGELPVNTDGGLKSFGHPVGASGLRMLYEVWLQLRGEAPPERRIPRTSRILGLTHNLGGYPGEIVSFVGIFGTQPDDLEEPPPFDDEEDMLDEPDLHDHINVLGPRRRPYGPIGTPTRSPCSPPRPPRRPRHRRPFNKQSQPPPAPVAPAPSTPAPAEPARAAPPASAAFARAALGTSVPAEPGPPAPSAEPARAAPPASAAPARAAPPASAEPARAALGTSVPAVPARAALGTSVPAVPARAALSTSVPAEPAPAVPGPPALSPSQLAELALGVSEFVAAVPGVSGFMAPASSPPASAVPALAAPASGVPDAVASGGP